MAKTASSTIKGLLADKWPSMVETNQCETTIMGKRSKLSNWKEFNEGAIQI